MMQSNIGSTLPLLYYASVVTEKLWKTINEFFLGNLIVIGFNDSSRIWKVRITRELLFHRLKWLIHKWLICYDKYVGMFHVRIYLWMPKERNEKPEINTTYFQNFICWKFITFAEIKYAIYVLICWNIYSLSGEVKVEIRYL